MFNTENVKSPVFTESGAIDLEINHPDFGWIPFTATPDDVEAHGCGLYEMAKAGEFGEVAEYVAPPEPESVLDDQ
ncbi:hypothetical protein [Bacterioplanoides sp.]|uniref:hypothetical protein n=1 Tax=Bacterioplanoides sp. TaxID=2066072 RepID=UPI003AFFA55D